MHGIGLHFKLDPSFRSNSARLAFSRPIRTSMHDLLCDEHEQALNPTDMNAIPDKWYAIKNLENRDRFLLAFFKRYGRTIYETLDLKIHLRKKDKWFVGNAIVAANILKESH